MSSISIPSSFYFNENRFKHNFENCINPVCTCPLEDESTRHFFFLHCHYYSALHISFLNDLNNISPQLLPDKVFAKTLYYENPIFDESDNRKILETSIRYILDPKRFSGNLL